MFFNFVKFKMYFLFHGNSPFILNFYISQIRTVEAIIKEGAIDVEAPATNEATAKPVENTPSTASSETATVSEAPVAASEVASSETVS